MKGTRVAIIGGGPGGTTLGSLLKRYKPEIEVVILEREKFPRDHVGESLLPAINSVLDEMGAWDKIEAADFPVKVGATYRWGATKDLWEFEFIPESKFEVQLRPAKYAGQRTRTAFQVDRSVYDKILLDHAKELGCIVREETPVVEILKTGDHVDGLKLPSGEIVEANHYIDASGNSGILRRAMGVEVDLETSLQNVAFWEYWRNAEWAVSIGIGGTKIQIMSLGYGWLWFIPLGPDRTSLGLVIPAEYYKKSGKKPIELYDEAVQAEPRIAKLLTKATREGKFYTTKDWSFLSTRLYGENWFLLGEAAGFADPILSAGLSLAHVGAHQLAHVIVALERGKIDPNRLRDFYDETQRKRIRQHIRFADFWYSANGVFTDLVDYTREIAKDAGLTLEAKDAFQWLGTGGFTHDSPLLAGMGGFSLAEVKQIMQQFTKTGAEWTIAKNNVFHMNLEGAERGEFYKMSGGRIEVESTYRRGDSVLPSSGFYGIVVSAVTAQHRMEDILDRFARSAYKIEESSNMLTAKDAYNACLQTLEGLIHEGWITAGYNPKAPLLDYKVDDESPVMHWVKEKKADQKVKAGRRAEKR